ncbi:hypothetical protein XBJ1_2806 [Xenorhabdus bovienii SS-2004]|uniref:Uncharacterized protein n=1 Tax=Xenorhabdus bovienii (strain SS-2004) TaxID=406818 RepID=D3V7W8_XENBS|nr:hypothetical protein XBJ1_2806 [Xenorhabdus bovienii SS-2004]
MNYDLKTSTAPIVRLLPRFYPEKTLQYDLATVTYFLANQGDVVLQKMISAPR